MRGFCLVTLAAVLLTAAPATADDAVRKDPKGQTGISPYNEILAEGRKAITAGDAGAAVTAFKKAVASQPNEMYGYLLLAQAQMRAGDDKAAYETVKLGRSKSGTEVVQAKMLMLFADLDERRANVPPPGHDAAKGVEQTSKDVWELVKETWSAYALFLTAHASLPNFKATADERKKQIGDRTERDVKYGAVRTRMAEEAKAVATPPAG